MSKPRTIKAVLANFLGSLLSRNSNSIGGFWLLGVAESELAGWRSDLLREPDNVSARLAPIDQLRSLSATQFREQLGKAGIAVASIASAEIRVVSTSDPVIGWAGEAHRLGRVFTFAASATTTAGVQFEVQEAAFVAPHDASVERSNRRTEGT
jgi:hypothetical protein